MMTMATNDTVRWDGDTPPQANKSTNNNNPFAALQEEEEEPQAEPPALFSFAPPSFVMPATTTNVDTAFDPDL